MQAAITSSKPGCSCREALNTTQRQQLLLVPARRRCAARPAAPTAAFGAAVGFGTAVGSANALSSAASTLGFALASVWLYLQLKAEKEAMREGRRECATCGGTGLIECICTKWSDRDTGCGACAGTGMMECTSCGGGGTAVPIEAKAYARSGQQQYRPRDYY